MTSRLFAGLGVAALLALAGCSSSSSAEGSAAVRTDKVDLPKSYKFAPAVIEVKAGTTVTWTNHDDFPHNVTLMTGPEQTSKHLGIGDSASFSFSQPGTVDYQCTLHPQQMQGKVIVTE
jgi:plastocyanin